VLTAGSNRHTRDDCCPGIDNVVAVSVTLSLDIYDAQCGLVDLNADSDIVIGRNGRNISLPSLQFFAENHCLFYYLLIGRNWITHLLSRAYRGYFLIVKFKVFKLLKVAKQ